jgi:hypothetical protein
MGCTGGDKQDIGHALVNLIKLLFVITIKGVYKEDNIKLPEEALSKRNQRVLVTFIEEEADHELGSISLNTSTTWFKNYLEDSGEGFFLLRKQMTTAILLFL